MKRTPLKRGTRLRKVSSRRRQQLGQYTLARKTKLAEQPACEVCRIAKAKDIHHKAGRNGARLYLYDNLLAVCRPCHDKIHRHPLWAREAGYLV